MLLLSKNRDTGLFGLAMMNAADFQQALEFFTRYLPLIADHSSFEDRAKDFILGQLSTENPTLEKLATHLYLVPRMMQRKLSASGKSFEMLISVVKRE